MRSEQSSDVAGGQSGLPRDEARLERDLAASSADGAAYGLMVGIGETYLQPFVLAIGHGAVFAGMIASVPQLLGGLLQMVSPAGVAALQSHARWVTVCVLMQAICFVPLVVGAWSGHLSAGMVMLIVSIYWAAGLGAGPAWNTWQGTLVPAERRATFFARRSRLMQFTTLVGFLAGGFGLQAGKASDREMAVYLTLFAVAGLARFTCVYCLTQQSEPQPMPPSMRRLPASIVWKRLTSGTTGRLLLFAIAMQAGVSISGPYFVPYMRRVLNHEYWEYTSILGVSLVAKFVTLPLWGRVAQRSGARALLWMASLSVVPMSIAWCCGSGYWWLVFVQVMAGVAWAAYELALLLMFFEAIPEDERTSILTAYNLANTLALVFGSLVGAALLKWWDVSATGYMFVFAASSLGRLMSLALLWRTDKGRPHVPHVPGQPIDESHVGWHGA